MTTTSDFSPELRAGALRLALRPDLGGSIAGLWHHDLPVMRSTEPGQLEGARTSSSFPLVPYSNRLGNRRFEWQGKAYTTQPNFNDSPHSLHGVAWLRAWQVLSHDASSVVLGYEHVPDAHWPFAFRVAQHFRLTPQQLDVRLVLTNTDTRAQPVGLGWHPYFPKRPGSRLDLDVTTQWLSDANLLPTHTVPRDGVHDTVARLDVDHCFAGWHGPALIRDEHFSLRLTASAGHVVVYTPPDKDYYCVEPVSHANDALHLPDPARHGLVSVAPGATAEAWMTLEVATA